MYFSLAEPPPLEAGALRSSCVYQRIERCWNVNGMRSAPPCMAPNGVGNATAGADKTGSEA
jgi:hypothetical protein